MPPVSIIIPAFNSQDYIAETLRSILDQSYQDFELLIVDDGSTDRTAEVIGTFEDPRIRYIHQANSGRPSIPRNRAIREARGDVIFIFDSDDLMLPDKLQHTVDAFDAAPSAGMVFTGFACIDEGGHVIDPDFLAPYETLHQLHKTQVRDGAWLIESRTALQGLARSNYVGTSGVAIRRQVFDAVGGFDEEVRNADDAIMWQAVASQFDLVFLPAIYHQYRVRSGSISLRNIEDRAPGIIKAITKMKRFHQHDATALDVLDGKIARYYHDMGYSYFSQLQLREAREAFRSARRLRPSNDSLFYIALSYLPAPAIRWLKKIKPQNRY
ncbi:glycosyltransferase family 2 protein [Marinobacter sp. JSM 1782161]|uniref:glycosyltransferase family 2 protein n=1 Tax=Marinobacter sp. JSM 1782161 TaxID=2685906 RepID=UPI0014033355|nr:glycosyltransferase family 2 protein [Marinobacter sp. JSM 1782161]